MSVKSIKQKVDYIQKTNNSLSSDDETSLEQKTSLIAYINAMEHYSPIVKKIKQENFDIKEVPLVFDKIATQSTLFAKKILKQINVKDNSKINGFILYLSSFYIKNILDIYSLNEILSVNEKNLELDLDIFEAVNCKIKNNLINYDFYSKEFSIEFTKQYDIFKLEMVVLSNLSKVLYCLNLNTKNSDEVKKHFSIIFENACEYTDKAIVYYLKFKKIKISDHSLFLLFDYVFTNYIDKFLLFYRDSKDVTKSIATSNAFIETLFRLSIKLI